MILVPLHLNPQCLLWLLLLRLFFRRKCKLLCFLSFVLEDSIIVLLLGMQDFVCQIR